MPAGHRYQEKKLIGDREGVIRDQTGLQLPLPELQFRLYPTGLGEVPADGSCGLPRACMVWCGMVWRGLRASCTHIVCPGLAGSPLEKLSEGRGVGRSRFVMPDCNDDSLWAVGCHHWLLSREVILKIHIGGR